MAATPIEQPRRRSGRRRLAIRAVAIPVLYVLGTFVDVWLGSRENYSGSADSVVVLGAAQYNGVPSPVLQNRLDHAAELYEQDRVQLIVVTGGKQIGDATTEAKTGYDYLRSLGIPDSGLLLEVDGASTYESLRATSRFLIERDITDVILVTDPYHSRRSQLVAGEVGLDAEVSPTTSGASFEQLARETAAVGLGRLISFRRLDAWS